MSASRKSRFCAVHLGLLDSCLFSGQSCRTKLVDTTLSHETAKIYNSQNALEKLHKHEPLSTGAGKNLSEARRPCANNHHIRGGRRLAAARQNQGNLSAGRLGGRGRPSAASESFCLPGQRTTAQGSNYRFSLRISSCGKHYQCTCRVVQVVTIDNRAMTE